MSAPTLRTPSGEPAPKSAEVVVHKVIEPMMSTRRRVGIGAAMLLLGAVSVLAFGLGTGSSHSARFDLNAGGTAITLPVIGVPAVATCVVLGLLICAAGGWQAVRGFSRRGLRLVAAGVAVAFLLTFLAWVDTGQPGQPIQFGTLLQQSLFLATPLILGALGGILCERSGVINVAIEGQLLTGAFSGALVATMAHNLGVGLVAAVIVGGLMGALLAVFAIKFFVNQVILGVVLNVFALGLTGFLFDAIMANNQNTTNNPGFFAPIKIPGLGDIPVVGPLLFDQNVIVYLTYVLILVIDIALMRTRWGLRTRAVGEHPKAADTVGINVLRTRYVNVMLGGCVAGLGGAFLTIGAVGQFTKNISSGNGFIALAAVIFGRWSPRGALGAALLFGFFDALSGSPSMLGAPVSVPSSLLGMLPYLATIFAVAGLVGRVRAPAADGEPYVK